MKVLLLAAGYGTRLYPLTENTPKPLLPIQKRPLMDYLLDKVKDNPLVKEVMVVTNHKFVPHFEAWAKEHKDFFVPIRIVDDGTLSNEDRLGSMGDIDFVIKKTHLNDDLLVLGGDNLFDEPMNDFLLEAQKNKPKTTVGVYDIKSLQEAQKFGVISIDQRNRIVSFEEKPKQPQSTLIGMCLYFLPAESLHMVQRYLHESKKKDTSGDYIKWLYQQQEVYCFTFQGKWYDIGSLEAYHDAEKNF